VKVKGDDCFDLNCIDSVTKYTTAHLFVEKRTIKKCIEFLSQIKITCYNQILLKYYIEKYKKIKKRKLVTFVCDGFSNYKTAFNKLFYRVAKLQFGVPIACKKYNLEYNNNPIERYNGNIKDRLNGMRSQFKSFEGAEAFMNLKDIIYNFVNPHQQLQGKTPAEMAEIFFPLRRNKLLELIRYMSKEKHHSLR
jgi:transposase-like protein